MSVEASIRELFAGAGARGYAHIREVGGADSVDVDADAPVTLASVIKIVFCLAFARDVVAGRIDDHERVEVPSELRLGGTGTAGCRDPVQMSLHDLARLMMSLSDNAATDVIVDRVGWPAISQVLTDLSLSRTHARGDMHWGHMGAVRELGLPDARNLDTRLRGADEQAIWDLAWLDPERANASTAREIGVLLEAIWTDAAGPPAACAFVREAMAGQVTRHRLAAGFPEAGMTIAAKSGSIPAIRNDAGVITYPDGRRYVATVFTRSDALTERLPTVDATIGAAARLAVDHLRALSAVSPRS